MKKKPTQASIDEAMEIAERFRRWEIAVLQLLMNQPDRAAVTDVSFVLSSRQDNPAAANAWRKHATVTIRTRSGHTYSAGGYDMAQLLATVLTQARENE